MAAMRRLHQLLRQVLAARQAARGATPRRRVILFSRHPTPGETKTRMIPLLGADGAADLHRRMTLHTLEWAAELRRQEPLAIELRFTGSYAEQVRAAFAGADRYAPQGDGDLGERLLRSFADAFTAGVHVAVAIGSDCPALTADVMRRAFAALEREHVVLGPATDGGYYLIGLRHHAGHPESLFRGIDWGTERVFDQTLAAARRRGLRVRLLEQLDDVDRPDDLAVWEAARTLLCPPALRGRVSVIVPALNEAAWLGATLNRIATAPPEHVEVIVADGGSDDQTVEIALAHGAKVVHGPRGRGTQMNAGAAAATGDVLLFCHADTLLPPGYERLARSTLADADVIAGAFTLTIDGDESALRQIERSVAWRCRMFQMPYGDQALFLRAATFRKLGGFAPLPLMEDYQLVRRLRRLGRIRTLHEPVLTSGRAWQQAGAFRATLVNQFVIAGYHLGVSPHTLARFRRRALTAEAQRRRGNDQ